MARKSFVTPIIIIEWSVLSFFSVLHCWKSSGTRSTVELAPSYQLLHIPPTLPFLNSNSYGSRVIPMNQSHLHVFPIFVCLCKKFVFFGTNSVHVCPCSFCVLFGELRGLILHFHRALTPGIYHTMSQVMSWSVNNDSAMQKTRTPVVSTIILSQ